MAKPIAIKLRRKKYKNFKLKINKLINWIVHYSPEYSSIAGKVPYFSKRHAKKPIITTMNGIIIAAQITKSQIGSSLNIRSKRMKKKITIVINAIRDSFRPIYY